MRKLTSYIITGMAFVSTAACTSDETPPTTEIPTQNNRPSNNTNNPQPNNRENNTTPDVGTMEDMGITQPDIGASNDSGPTIDMGMSVDMGEEEDMNVIPNPVNPPPGWPAGRGWDWVRNNPPFISGLVVRMAPPPSGEVDRYYDDFGATALHVWQSDYPTSLNAWRNIRSNEPWLAWTDFDGTSVVNGQVIGGYNANESGRIGWQIGDEPRTAADWDETKIGLTAVRAADPDALLIVNYTYQAAEIDRFLREGCNTEQDIVSYDRYTRRHNAYESLALFRDAAIACGVPYWRYIKSYRTPGEDEQTESDMRWAAMIGILYGYTGHSWFLYKIREFTEEGIPTNMFTSPDTWGGSTTDHYNWVSQINRELLSYGQAVSNLMSLDIRTVPSLIAPDGAPAWSAGAGGDPYLTDVDVAGTLEDVLLGFFIDRNHDRYVVALNPNHTNGDFPTSGDSAINVTLKFDFSGQTAVRSDRLKRLQGDGTIVDLPVANGEVTVNIPAGDIVFFKYDSGRPFAGY